MGGLPGTGKTTHARLLAARIGAVHLRVDTIEQAIVRSGAAPAPDWSRGLRRRTCPRRGTSAAGAERDHGIGQSTGCDA
ncbi:AAA family ATPase [Streptomyces sp. NPDC046759]|uniref:AAA family ATPase n=1 Tax=Streptomyces sp. NPDC046759 TaxID=3155019 RepID=UPI0034059983